MMPLTVQTEVGPAGFVALCWSKRRAPPEHKEGVKMKCVYALESRTGLMCHYIDGITHSFNVHREAGKACFFHSTQRSD